MGLIPTVGGLSNISGFGISRKRVITTAQDMGLEAGSAKKSRARNIFLMTSVEDSL